jgi:hypothetical protein
MQSSKILRKLPSRSRSLQKSNNTPQPAKYKNFMEIPNPPEIPEFICDTKKLFVLHWFFTQIQRLLAQSTQKKGIYTDSRCIQTRSIEDSESPHANQGESFSDTLL